MKPNLETARALLATMRPTNAVHVALQVHGEINDAMADRVTTQLDDGRRANTITLSVDSPGGDLFAARRIVRAIDRHRAHRKLAYGQNVHSAAALIFAAGNVRRLFPDASVLFHQVELEPSGSRRWTSDAYEAQAKTLVVYNETFAKDVAARCCVPTSVILAKLQDERETPLVEALSCGFAHEIIGVTPPLQKSWPMIARQKLQKVNRFTAGTEARWFNPSFLAACEIGAK